MNEKIFESDFDFDIINAHDKQLVAKFITSVESAYNDEFFLILNDEKIIELRVKYFNILKRLQRRNLNLNCRFREFKFQKILKVV